MRELRARKRAEREALARRVTAERDVGTLRQDLLPLLPADGREPEPLPPPGGGRPRGSGAAADWRRYMLERYRSPLVVLAETYSRDVGQLASELGCTRLEAFDRQLRAAIEAAGYLHSKAPASLQVDGVAVAPLVFGVTPGMASRLGMEARPVVEVVEDQSSSRDEEGQV